MKYSEIRLLLEQRDISGDLLFKTARSVAYFHQSGSSDKAEALDLIVRLLDKREYFESRLRGISSMIDAIAREAGLYPYIVGRGDWSDELATELMRAPGLPDIVFHIEQAQTYRKLAEGGSLVLSAPTSFGKSLLIDALIAHRRPRTVVAVVPTIALLDEFRRRMEARFKDYQVISRSKEERVGERAIFVGTQERLLENSTIGSVDLFVVDEFYKLDLERNDRRSIALNTILSRYARQAKQIYLLGPSINDVRKRSLGGALRDKILDLDTVLSRRPVSALCLDLRSRPISS